MRRRSVLLVAATVVLLSAAPGAPLAQVALGTAIRYQGRLTDTGAPANGVYALQFALFDAPAGGALVGAVVTALAIE